MNGPNPFTPDWEAMARRWQEQAQCLNRWSDGFSLVVVVLAISLVVMPALAGAWLGTPA